MGEYITFEVVGDPVAQARPRAVRFGDGIRVYDPKKVKDYKSYFKMCAVEAMNGRAPFDAPVIVTLDIYIQKPKSWSKKRIYADTRPDADNYAKASFDAMEGVVYTNDSRIIALCVEKHLSDRPRCEVSIEVLE
jgi:Holliday junction resolvase RusA-like endonuclease